MCNLLLALTINMSTADKILDNSDSNRSARPLLHAQSVIIPGPIQLACGDSLPEVNITYETYGALNAARDNAVFICHALTGDSHVARHDEQDDPGWWDVLIGPGKYIDTRQFFVICANVLGGCRGTTGPSSIHPRTRRPYGGDFPLITIGDIVHVHHLLLEHLKIPRLRALVGGSLGGHMVLDWAIRYPDQTQTAIVLASSGNITPQTLAFDVVARNAILADPDFSGGHYYHQAKKPKNGLAIARMLGHITYLSPESMAVKFQDADNFSYENQYETSLTIESYLSHQGKRFVDRFDANSYIVLTQAMDQFSLGRTRSDFITALSPARCRWLLMSFSSDWLFPPHQSMELALALERLGRPVKYVNIESPHGHDAFLLKHDAESYGEAIRAALINEMNNPATAFGVLHYDHSY